MIRTVFTVISLFVLTLSSLRAATLDGTFSPIAQGSNVNLTVEGKLDWVHWGLYTDSSLNRKATVVPKIRDFTVVYNPNVTFAAPYQYADNYNGYTWSDGTQVVGATNTTTGIYVLGGFNPTDTNGFAFTVPADTNLKTLKVYVGAYAARGRFIATLSDHPVSYSDTALSNFSNGPGGVYTINFAANSANQTLTLRWAVTTKNQPDGNVTLQAATLSSSTANNPPFARIINPQSNSSYAMPANMIISVDAIDYDGSISKVELFQNETKIGESTVSPYEFSWNGIAAGSYQVTAKVSDNLGAVSVSAPVDVFVHETGGTLVGFVGSPPSVVDLTSEGVADWTHWGLLNATNMNHKVVIPIQVQAFSKLGTNVIEQMADNEVAVTWSDGTPVSSVSGSQTAIFTTGITNGFEFSVRARTNVQTLKVYVGLYGGAGKFQAWLSDFSAPAFCDRSLTNAWGNSYAVYTLSFAATSPQQSLLVRYTSDFQFDQDYGNVVLQAATLNGPGPVRITDLESFGNYLMFAFPTFSGASYTVEYNDFLSTNAWQVLTNVPGDGQNALINDSASHSRRFYRVKTD